MSQHPSLRSSAKDKQHRSVLKRYEKIRILKDKELWKEENSVFGLSKVKVTRFKIKKEKAAAAEGTEAAAAVPGAAAAPAAGATKAGAPAKPAAQAKGPAKEAGKGSGASEAKK